MYQYLFFLDNKIKRKSIVRKRGLRESEEEESDNTDVLFNEIKEAFKKMKKKKGSKKDKMDDN